MNSDDRDQHLKVAHHYEQQQKQLEAGTHYSLAGEYDAALKLFMVGGEMYLDNCIKVVAAAKSDVLTHTLMDYLTGDKDGQAKDPQYVFKLLQAIGKHDEANNLS